MNRNEMKRRTASYIDKARAAEAAIDQTLSADGATFRELEDVLAELGTPRDLAFAPIDAEEEYYRELAEDDLGLGNYESGIPAHRYGTDN